LPFQATSVARTFDGKHKPSKKERKERSLMLVFPLLKAASKLQTAVFLAIFAYPVLYVGAQHYNATWASIDSRSLPTWYDEAKFGIFINWGVYSVPSFGSEWFWWYWKGDKNKDYIAFMKQNYKPGFTYADFGPMFTAEFFNATRFAETIKRSGAQ